MAHCLGEAAPPRRGTAGVTQPALPRKATSGRSPAKDLLPHAGSRLKGRHPWGCRACPKWLGCGAAGRGIGSHRAPPHDERLRGQAAEGSAAQRMAAKCCASK
mmetsp:Transcript_4939/g.11380  ORF Transcript_4939/g.11380 Transcript_4939/m.11380 type:complete len:103 (+) Transcript_4939:620-928(+)